MTKEAFIVFKMTNKARALPVSIIVTNMDDEVILALYLQTVCLLTGTKLLIRCD
jgi:hypothetical protein